MNTRSTLLRSTLLLLLLATLGSGCVTQKFLSPETLQALAGNTNSIELELVSPHFGTLKYKRNMDRFTTAPAVGSAISIIPTTTLQVQPSQ